MKAKRRKAVTKRFRGLVSCPTAARLRLAGVHDGLEEGAGSQDHGTSTIKRSSAGNDANNSTDCRLQIADCRFVSNPQSAICNLQSFHGLLPQRKVRLLFDSPLHLELVLFLVGLRPR